MSLIYIHWAFVKERENTVYSMFYAEWASFLCDFFGKANLKPTGKDLMGLRHSCTEDPTRQVFICLSILEGKGLAQGQTLQLWLAWNSLYSPGWP